MLTVSAQAFSSNRSMHQRGAVLPLLTLVVALLAALLLGITQLLHSSAQNHLNQEKAIHSEMHSLFEEALQFNALASNNRLIAKQAENIITVLEQYISWGFDLAFTTPLWEQKLPIPEKYDLFRRVSITLAPVLRDLSEIAAQQVHFKENLKLTEQAAIIPLNLLQSLCSLSCLKRNTTLRSSATCNSISSHPADCEIQLKSFVSGISQDRFISVKSLLEENILRRGGFMLLDPNIILKTNTQRNPVRFTAEPRKSNNVLVGIVHPRLCAHPKNTFLVPCSQNQSIARKEPRNLLSLAVEPHWSVAVEF